MTEMMLPRHDRAHLVFEKFDLLDISRRTYARSDGHIDASTQQRCHWFARGFWHDANGYLGVPPGKLFKYTRQPSIARVALGGDAKQAGGGVRVTLHGCPQRVDDRTGCA